MKTVMVKFDPAKEIVTYYGRLKDIRFNFSAAEMTLVFCGKKKSQQSELTIGMISTSVVLSFEEWQRRQFVPTIRASFADDPQGLWDSYCHLCEHSGWEHDLVIPDLVWKVDEKVWITNEMPF